MVSQQSSRMVIEVDPSSVVRRPPRTLLGQAVWAGYEAYSWDPVNDEPRKDGLELAAALELGALGHYPGVGVITHDFHWKNLIGPRDARQDPTPRESFFDTPRQTDYGPDEYGRHLDAYRAATGREVEGSIQVNIMTSTPEDAADWVEYMNAPDDGAHPWAAERAKNGHPEPYRIRYWELGNEPHFTAQEIGSLTAPEYVERVLAWVAAMKERDPSIVISAYVNAFFIGDPLEIGKASPEHFVEGDPAGRTWTQYVIAEAGDALDAVYFHWYGAWSDNLNETVDTYTSMYTALVPLLDRLAADIEHFAPSPEARDRLRRNVHIPEWHVLGSWVHPVISGTALQGALSASRTLHCLVSRPEVQSAQHMMLSAPYPEPALASDHAGFEMPEFFDIRAGYATLLTREEDPGFLRTALYEAQRLWAGAWGDETVAVALMGAPALANGIPAVDVTAFRTGDSVRVVVTNTSYRPQDLVLRVAGVPESGVAQRTTLFGLHRFVNNEWDRPNLIQLKESEAPISEGRVHVQVAAQSLESFVVDVSA